MRLLATERSPHKPTGDNNGKKFLQSNAYARLTKLLIALPATQKPSCHVLPTSANGRNWPLVLGIVLGVSPAAPVADVVVLTHISGA